MTQAEELAYLYGIVSESRLWNTSETHQNAVELEIDSRIKKLLEALNSTAPATVQETAQRRARPSEAVEKPGWSLNQFRYLMRASLKDLDDDAVRAEYDKYLERTKAPVQTSAQELSAAEKMRQEEQCWAEHFKQRAV